jgi:CheY-like chemotaxis protein
MELKVLVLGRKSVTRRVFNALIDSSVSITLQNDVSDAIVLLKNERFDLTLVDGYMDNLESVCYRLTWQGRVPVVLLVNGKETDWNLLKTMDIDGFIPDDGGKSEIVAYFNSITRRLDYRRPTSKILIIEDDPQTVESLRLAFEIYWPEAEVKCALTGKEGLLYTRVDPANIVLLDLKLPDISGFEVLSRIRSISQVPVVVISATRTPEYVIKAIDLGANDYIVKPFKQINLMSRIKQQLTPGIVVNKI